MKTVEFVSSLLSARTDMHVAHLQAIVDDVLELINTTCYKLKFLSH